MSRAAAVAVIAAALLAAGCASPTAPASGAAADPAERTEGRRWLERGIAQFEQGHFAEAIRLLQESPEIAADSPQVRAQALKYVAFGQCVTGRRTACRRTFDALLALDPSFALQPAEVGHPDWGPEFDAARAARSAAAGRAAR